MDSAVDRVPTIGISDFDDPNNRLTASLFERLRSWAALVLLCPTRDHRDLASLELDLYHMGHWHRAALRDLKRASQGGIATVNSYWGSSLTTDRLAKLLLLREFGVPVPEFQYGTASEITLEPPVLAKPRDELTPRGHEFTTFFTDSFDFDGKRVVQRYIVPRRSYKVFSVGENVRTGEHGWKDWTLHEVRTPRYFHRLAEKVSGIFDLSLFELDVVVHKAVYVIDVNPVVSLEGVTDAVDLYETCLREAVPGR